MHKYNAKKCTYEGINFDSEHEMQYYIKYLKDKENVILQPKFQLVDGITYIADFQIDNVVIDVKGFNTPEFTIKKKLFKHFYPNLELQLFSKTPQYLHFFVDEFILTEKLDKIMRLLKNFKKKFGYIQMSEGRLTPALIENIKKIVEEE